MIEIRYVKEEDKEFWYSLDGHLPEAEFNKKVRDKQGYVLCGDGMPKGLLRYGLFWDNTPFCNLLCMKKLVELKLGECQNYHNFV